MWSVLVLLLSCVVAGRHGAIPNFYDIGDEEECPSGTRCMPADLCPGAAQPFGPFSQGAGARRGVTPGFGQGWVPTRRRPARCASALPGARVCCWTPAALPPPYQPRFRPVRQASASPSQRACEEYRRSESQRPFNTLTFIAHGVVGGQQAQQAEFPYMVAIGYVRASSNANSDIVWGCGGSLVSDRYVLTAAHCVTDAQRLNMRPVALRTGVNHLSQGPQLPDDYTVENITLHPRHRGDQKYYDLALLRTDRPVAFNAAQSPVCLATPETNFDTTTPLYVAGWGATDPSGIDMSDSLKKAVLRMVEPEECRKFIQESKALPRGLDDSMICAAEPSRQADTCTGDSGGPLAVRGPQGDVLVGVTSFGGLPCANANPGVYAGVQAELPWIESIVWS